MASELPTILSAEGQLDTKQSFDISGGGISPKKIIIIFLGLILALIVIGFFVFRSFFSDKETVNQEQEISRENELPQSNPALPLVVDPSLNNISDIATSTDLMIEYLSFSDFYEKRPIEIRANFEDYDLPLNTKIEVINYYDVSRKLNLDNVISSINNNGFALIDNPWREASDFYSIYVKLREKQIPLFISSDFLIYYHQNIIKKVFKDIEENIFYDNLWDVSKELYERSKMRYESRLASIGDINDPLLEGARLETVFFAVTLELLKPLASQIAPTGVQVNQDKFSVSEANRFYFNIPVNLKNDIDAEVSLIREGEKKIKSPIFLYIRDYSDFIVPLEYQGHAKLNNFYLASRWLNSVFPLYYQEDNCSPCLLDREDWRINSIASLLITEDFSSLPQIKNRWARIYKVISFFKGLKDDLDYVNYREALLSVFGDNYQIEDLFQDPQNVDTNLNKVITEIAKYQFSEIQGGPSVNDFKAKVDIGFKVLADSFFPDDYLLNQLSSNEIGLYLGNDFGENNITACDQLKTFKRCNGFAFDILNLSYSLNNPYFIENTNYQNYQKEANRLKVESQASINQRVTNYWSTLALNKELLNFDKKLMPIFAQSDTWNDKSLKTASAAWANMHIPFEKFSINKSFTRNLDDFSRWNENSYIEPNLALVNELISINDMVLGALSALRVDSEIKQVNQEITTVSNNLEKIRAIIIKQITGEELTLDDFEFISDFTGQLEITEPIKDKSFNLKPQSFVRDLRVSINSIKLAVIVSQRGGQKIFSVGPVWDYQESVK